MPLRKASAYADAIREGINTRGANGILFVDILERGLGWVRVRNDPSRGRSQGRTPQFESPVESESVRLLIRGEDVARECATPHLGVLFFHDERHVSKPLTEEEATERFPRAVAFAKHFQRLLQSRQRFRNFDPTGEEWLGLYSVTTAILAEHKVVIREIASDLVAAPLSGKEMIPDHKLYVIPCATEEETQRLSFVLNSDVVRAVVRSFSINTSFTGSLLRYVGIRPLDGPARGTTPDDRLAEFLGLSETQLRTLRAHID